MITVIKKIVRVINQQPPPLTVIKRFTTIRVTAQNPQQGKHIMRNFFFVATEGQTIFTLTSGTPRVSGVFDLYINGAGQSASKTPTPDFIVSGNTITLSEGVSEGDAVYGFYELA